MKPFKLPKAVNICGVQYRVRQDRRATGGAFDIEKAEIVIGTRVPHDVLDTFLHEVIEGIYAVRNMRYAKQVADPDNGDYVFHYNHEEHHHAMADIAAALKGLRL